MSSILGLKRHVALFFDDSGHFVDTKTFSISFKHGIKKSLFEFNGGSYNIKPYASRAFIKGVFLFDTYYYIYNINNPDPISISSLPIPLMSPKAYNIQLNNKLLQDLNRVRQGGLLSLLTPRTLIIIALVFAALVYFMSGGTVT